MLTNITVARCMVCLQNMKAHENRKQIFSSNTSRENPFARQAKAITEPPPWSGSGDAFGNSQPSV